MAQPLTYNTYDVNGNKTGVFPCFPGGYGYCNTNTTSTGHIPSLMIFTSIGDLTNSTIGYNAITIDQSIDAFYILPGFKMVIWAGTNFTGTTANTNSQIFDNTNGKNVKFVVATAPNSTSSIQLYYKNVLIPEPV